MVDSDRACDLGDRRAGVYDMGEEQTMSEELIRRRDAIDVIHSYWKGEINKLPVTDSEYGEVIEEDCYTILEHNKELSTRIKAVPTADRPQGEWIPCSERLPEVHEEPYYADHEAILYESDHVLTCCKCGKGFVYAIGTVIHDEVCDSYEWSDLYDYADCVIDDMQVLAWMPLPKPWKGADDE